MARRILGPPGMPVRVWLGVLCAVLLAGADASGRAPLVASALAQPGASATNAPAEADVVQNLQRKLAEARASLAVTAVGAESALSNAPAGISIKDIATRRALISRLVRVIEQELSNLSELETTRARRAEVARVAKAWTRFAEPPPYSILLTDRLREESQAEQIRIDSCTAAVTTLDQLLEENRELLSQAEGSLRQLDEQLEGASQPVAVARLSWQRELERLRSQVAVRTVAVLESERRLREESLSESRIRLDWLKRQLVVADASATFFQADLDAVTARIEQETRQLERELDAAESRSTNTLAAVELAARELRAIQVQRDHSAEAEATASEVLALRQAQFETSHAAVRVLRMILETESVERVMWEMRFAAQQSRSVSALVSSERRLKSMTRRTALWREYQRQQLKASPSQLELQEMRIRNLPPDSELLPLALEKLSALQEQDQLLLRLVRRIDQVQRLGRRWAEGLQVAEAQLSLLGRVENVFSDAGSFLQKLWNFELLSAEDTIVVDGQKITGRRSITLGKIAMAILILVLGIWITGLVSRVIEPLIVRRLKIEANQARLVRRWLRAAMVLCLVVFSLVSVKIPLTVFAFAGGALAIGLGFGMQTLLKNFVSGLILLFERPFRVGDVLEVGGQRGMVTEIGLRSSVLELWDGTETLIPNSSLLENNVSNWTYTHRKVRFSLSVGVAYGSDTRRVIQLLSEAVERHGVVEKDPKPQVLFTDFGESALTFEVRYWVDVIKGNAAQVGSDLRQMIVGAFSENGINIAFPQRDVHLDTAKPLSVSIVTPFREADLNARENRPPTPL